MSLFLFAAAGVVFYFSLRGNRDLTDLKHFHGKDTPYFSGNIYYMPDGSRPYYSVGSKTTWASKSDKSFAISFFDNETKSDNLDEVHKTVRRTPWIVWIHPAVFIVLAAIMPLMAFGFYEAVIPYFENMIMTDEAFMFVDYAVFYFPSGFALFCAVSCLVLRVIKINVLHECALRIAEDNKAAEDRRNTIGEIESVVGRRWYYNECPNCGALPPVALKSCPHCGSSLEVPTSKATDPRIMHRSPSAVVKTNSNAPVRKQKG